MAIAAAVESKYDVFVSDLRMPKRDGLALLAELKARSPHCEVLIVTSFGNNVTVVKNAMRLGALDYCLRDNPASLNAIAASVRDALSRKPSRRAPGFHREHLIDFFLHRLANRDEEFREGVFPPGVALEYITKLLLDSCRGFSTDWMRAKTKSEEIDLVCLNRADDAFWKRQGSLILVECKDKKQKAGANERTRFETKIARRRPQSNIGIFVSSSGFAATFHEPAVGSDPPIIVRIEKTDLTEWIRAENRLEWLTRHSVDQIIHR